MSEPRPIYNTLSDNDMAKIRKATINGEPLSTKQLHELITSQAMTIDRLYGEVGRYRKVLTEIVWLLERTRRFSAMWKARKALEGKEIKYEHRIS